MVYMVHAAQRKVTHPRWVTFWYLIGIDPSLQGFRTAAHGSSWGGSLVGHLRGMNEWVTLLPHYSGLNILHKELNNKNRKHRELQQ